MAASPTPQTDSNPLVAGYSASNYRKHMSSNPVQRFLIDRFHRQIADRIAAMAPESFLDAGCGEGFVAKMLLERMPGLKLTGFDFDPAGGQAGSNGQPHLRLHHRQHLRDSVPGSIVRRGWLLRGVGAPDRSAAGPARVGPRGQAGRHHLGAARAVLLAFQRGPGQELGYPSSGKRSRSQAALVAGGARRVRCAGAGCRLAGRFVPVDHLYWQKTVVLP